MRRRDGYYTLPLGTLGNNEQKECKLYEDELLEFGGPGLAGSIPQETASGWEEYGKYQKYLMDRLEAALGEQSKNFKM